MGKNDIQAPILTALRTEFKGYYDNAQEYIYFPKIRFELFLKKYEEELLEERGL